MKRKRASGTGPLRLNEKLHIREDLYSFLFITCFHAEYIREAQKLHKKEEELLETAIDFYKEEVDPHWKRFHVNTEEEVMPSAKGLAAALMNQGVVKMF